ncbi:MAG: hypothetical protein K2H48_03570 [Duncaniella sp.]|nr:hypothetical protein [Duncaniella sp.]
MNKLNLLVPFFLVSFLFSFTQADELNNSPYKIFGDNTPVLDASHSKTMSSWSILVVLHDSSVASLKLSGDYIILTDSVGDIISTHLIDRSIIASMFRTMDPKAEEMAWISPYAFCAGDPIQFIDKDGQRPTAYEASLMASAVYRDEKTYVDRIQKLSDLNWTISSVGSNIQKNHPANTGIGLQSMIFERKTENGMEYAYVFAGTSCWEDGVEDVTQLFGLSPQYAKAISNTKALIEEIKDSELTLVGHSMGGGEAAAASIATGKDAITFNPAVVSKHTLPYSRDHHRKNITNYISCTPEILGISVPVDIITLLQFNICLTAPGTSHPVAVGFTPSHGIDAIVDTLRP